MNDDNPNRPADEVDNLLAEYCDAYQVGHPPDLEAFLAAHPQHAEELRGLIETFHDFMANRRAGGDAVERLLRDADQDRLRRVLPEVCPGCGDPFHPQLSAEDGTLPAGCRITSLDLVAAAEDIADEARPLREPTPEEQAEAEQMWQRFKAKVFDPEIERRRREREK